MRQVKTLAQMITLQILLLFLLTSCSSVNRGETLALDIRTALLQASKLQLTTSVTADYGERVYDFTFNYTGNANGGIIEIISPDQVAGLKAEVSVSGDTIEYDGAALDTGAVTRDGLSPVQAVPVLISQWQSGYISGYSFEKLADAETLAVNTKISETVSERTWFDTKTLQPIRSELYDGNKMVIACRFENIIIE